MRLATSLRAVSDLGSLLAGAPLCSPASANPAILFDLKTGKVLEHEDAFQRWHPASLTKLMTAYVTFRAVAAGELALDSPIKMTKHSASEPPSKMGFKAGSVMTLDNALKMMLIKSANDIAMAVGENVGGSEEAFVERMNAEALRLGMTDSHFANPNGLHSPDQYTTARDLALLVSRDPQRVPAIRALFRDRRAESRQEDADELQHARRPLRRRRRHEDRLRLRLRLQHGRLGDTRRQNAGRGRAGRNLGCRPHRQGSGASGSRIPGKHRSRFHRDDIAVLRVARRSSGRYARRDLRKEEAGRRAIGSRRRPRGADG